MCGGVLGGCGEGPDGVAIARWGVGQRLSEPPLYWSEQLNHSARFHAAEMSTQQYFAHDSKCTVVQNIDSLYPLACDGSASCGCCRGDALAPRGATAILDGRWVSLSLKSGTPQLGIGCVDWDSTPDSSAGH